MDVSKFMESDFVTLDFLKNCKVKKFVIISSGVQTTKYGDRIKLLIGIDGGEKTWTLSNKLVSQIAEHVGVDDSAWSTKVFSYQFVGKELALFPA